MSQEQRQLVPHPAVLNGSSLLLAKASEFVKTLFDNSGYNQQKRRNTSHDLEKLFFARPWWNLQSYDIIEEPEAHSGRTYRADNIQRDVELEGLRLNLKNVIRKAQNTEYLFPQQCFNDFWTLVNNYSRRFKLNNYDEIFSQGHAQLHAYINDIHLMLLQIDQNEMIKKDLQICCAVFRSVPFRHTACRGKDCQLMVEIGSNCYIFANGNSYIISDRERAKLVVCPTCFDKAEGELIEVRRRKPDAIRTEWAMIMLRKDQFRRTTWTSDACIGETEPMVQCIYCNNRFHYACIMHDEFSLTKYYEAACPEYAKFFKAKYVCQECCSRVLSSEVRRCCPNKPIPPSLQKNLEYLPHSMPSPQLFSEKSFIRTDLSIFMETELQKYLFQLSCELNCPVQDLQVRVLCSRRKVFYAKPRMKLEFEKKQMPTRKEYNYKSIMIFQKDRNSDNYTAIFNLIVHEYPESGAINLSYIDSVKLFQPAHLRPQVYRRIVETYLKYAQQLGTYKSLHIWVCPPKGGDEYVFYGRPEPGPECRPKSNYNGLINWYKAMLNDCIREGVIKEFVQSGPHKNPYKEHTDVPYMAEDFWVDRLEKLLEDYEADREAWEASQNQTESPLPALRKPGGSATKSRASPLRVPRKQPNLNQMFNDVVKTESSNLLFTAYFVAIEEPNKVAKEEPDKFCVYMSTRDCFLMDCRESSNDFSDPRRATYTTAFLFSRLAQESLSLKCKICEKLCRAGWYCIECDEAVFCSMDCAKTHDEHPPPPDSSPSSLVRPFVVPLDKIHPILDEAGLEIFSCLARSLIGETLSLIHTKLLLAEAVKRKGLILNRNNLNSCVNFIFTMLNFGKTVYAKPICKRFKLHLRFCSLCVRVWNGMVRHWKICRPNICLLGVCNLQYKCVEKSSHSHSPILAIKPRSNNSTAAAGISKPPRLQPQPSSTTTASTSVGAANNINPGPGPPELCLVASLQNNNLQQIQNNNRNGMIKNLKRKMPAAENHKGQAVLLNCNPAKRPNLVCVGQGQGQGHQAVAVADVQPTSTLVPLPGNSPNTARVIQIQNSNFVNNTPDNSSRSRTMNLNTRRLIDIAVQNGMSQQRSNSSTNNGFTPLASYSGQSTALSSQLPFTDTLLVFRNKT